MFYKKLVLDVITPLVTFGPPCVFRERWGASEISSTSIRGALRWWYRWAVLGSSSLGEGSQEGRPELYQYEWLLFGDEEWPPSPIMLRSRVIGKALPIKGLIKLLKNTKEKYFRNFRLRGSKGYYIPPGSKIEIELLLRPEYNIPEIAPIVEDLFAIYEDLFKIISLVGGLGNGWRRGLGSVQLEGLKLKESPEKGALEDHRLEEQLRSLIDSLLSHIESIQTLHSNKNPPGVDKMLEKIKAKKIKEESSFFSYYQEDLTKVFSKVLKDSNVDVQLKSCECVLSQIINDLKDNSEERGEKKDNLYSLLFRILLGCPKTIKYGEQEINLTDLRIPSPVWITVKKDLLHNVERFYLVVTLSPLKNAKNKLQDSLSKFKIQVPDDVWDQFYNKLTETLPTVLNKC